MAAKLCMSQLIKQVDLLQRRGLVLLIGFTNSITKDVQQEYMISLW